MKVSCGCPRQDASAGLVDSIKALGITPIVTSYIVRAVYDGPDVKLGEAIVEVFSKEKSHDDTIIYEKNEQQKPEQPKRSKKRRRR